MWDLIVSVPDHCLSFYFPFGPSYGPTHYQGPMEQCLGDLNMKLFQRHG